MARNSRVAYAQTLLNDARRALHDAVDDFSIPHETLLELRAESQRAFEEVKELDGKAARGGLFGFLKFWQATAHSRTYFPTLRVVQRRMNCSDIGELIKAVAPAFTAGAACFAD